MWQRAAARDRALLHNVDRSTVSRLKARHAAEPSVDPGGCFFGRGDSRRAVGAACSGRGDGVKIPKRGKKMPAVKLLHQQSESNTKPE